MSTRYLAIVNPAAGAGRAGKQFPGVLARLRAAGIHVEIAETKSAGHGIQLARGAALAGITHYIAVGGDGTAFEVLNGLFTAAGSDAAHLKGSVAPPFTPTLGFLPLGTGNSFLRDFSQRGLEPPLQAILGGRARPCDVLRLTHRLPEGQTGVLHGINLFSVGFPADVGALVNRRLKPFGYLGYSLGILMQLARFHRRPFPVALDDDPQPDPRPCVFLSFNNSRYTGGNMLVAPLADAADGLIEYVRLNPIGRLALLRNLRRLYDGTSTEYAAIERRAVRSARFQLDGPVDVMADGEILRLHCERMDILPSAINVMV